VIYYLKFNGHLRFRIRQLNFLVQSRMLQPAALEPGSKRYFEGIFSHKTGFVTKVSGATGSGCNTT
jgi:hypothetical protein